MQTCQATITKEGDRRRCKHPAMPGGRFCASHQDLPSSAVARLWWTFRVHGSRMFSPEWREKGRKMMRDVPPTLGRADRGILRLLATLRRWSGDRRNVQAAIVQAVKLERVSLWPGQLHVFRSRWRVRLCHLGVRPETTVVRSAPPGWPLSKVSVSPNSHDFLGSTPSPGIGAGNSGQAVQGRKFKGGT